MTVRYYAVADEAALDCLLTGLPSYAAEIVATPLTGPDEADKLGACLVAVETFTRAARVAFSQAAQGIAIRVRSDVRSAPNC